MPVAIENPIWHFDLQLLTLDCLHTREECKDSKKKFDLVKFDPTNISRRSDL
jgi:23S rRNA G2069 N7-methylase RlmK/C1962 C5-methylase RlmI